MLLLTVTVPPLAADAAQDSVGVAPPVKMVQTKVWIEPNPVPTVAVPELNELTPPCSFEYEALLMQVGHEIAGLIPPVDVMGELAVTDTTQVVHVMFGVVPPEDASGAVAVTEVTPPPVPQAAAATETLPELSAWTQRVPEPPRLATLMTPAEVSLIRSVLFVKNIMSAAGTTSSAMPIPKLEVFVKIPITVPVA